MTNDERQAGGFITDVHDTERPQPYGQPAVVPADQVKNLLAALDDAAEYQRNRAETCADCANQSCTTCQWRLRAAEAYDQVAAQMIHAAETSAARQRAAHHPPPPSPGQTRQVTR
jgi:hypothetical protein